MAIVRKKIVMLVITIMLGTLAIASSQVLPSEKYKKPTINITQKFEEWIAEHNRVYSNNSENERRYENFKKNYEQMRAKYNNTEPEAGFEYAVDYGFNREITYPFIGRDQPCNAKLERYPYAKISGYLGIPPNDENLMKKYVASQPIAAVMEITRTFYHHTDDDGVYQDEFGECGRLPMRNRSYHAVTVVGYGTDEDDMDYWLVKNSWGREGGYFRIQRNVDKPGGLCDIASWPSYPFISRDRI